MGKIATPEMLNAIRNDASDTYRAVVPEATRGNLLDVGNPIVNNYQKVANEFIDALVNKIIFTVVERQTWKNPLGRLRRNDIPLGYDVEMVQTNPASAEQYGTGDTEMASLLKEQLPDSATAYFRLNRKDRYKVTIYNNVLRHAFTSWGNLEDMIAQITDSLYNGNTIDEFLYTKNLISSALAANKIQTKTTVMPVNEATGKQFMNAVRGLSTAFTFPSTSYNNYVLNGGTNPRMTWTPTDRQIILVRGDVASAVGVDVLSAAFNLNYADYLAPQIIVDEFDAAGKILAVVADERAFFIATQLRQFAEFFNAAVLGWQYYYHAWDWFSLNPLYNAVALVTA